eukprot:COSAG06_NODE_5173_length_3662_cov_3.246422_1_plen_120_part_10
MLVYYYVYLKVRSGSTLKLKEIIVLSFGSESISYCSSSHVAPRLRKDQSTVRFRFIAFIAFDFCESRGRLACQPSSFACLGVHLSDVNLPRKQHTNTVVTRTFTRAPTIAILTITITSIA